MSESKVLEQRVERLEELISYLEETVSVLNSTIIEQGSQLSGMRESSLQLTNQLKSMQDAMEDKRTSEDERPPHY
ncbi:MAG: SlyX family protein [Pirellulales bacterium]